MSSGQIACSKSLKNKSYGGYGMTTKDLRIPTAYLHCHKVISKIDLDHFIEV
jgi:hypothetical protein